MRLSYLLALMAAILLPGCATVFDGVSQTVTIRTAPEGASCRVERSNEVIGEIPSTPGFVEVARSRHDIMAVCQKPGWEPVVAKFPAMFTGTTFANFGVGGAVGFIVDASTGANFRYDEDRTILMTPQIGMGAARRPLTMLSSPAS